MRIIAGQWRSRPLQTAPDLDTRPTAARTRETLFSMLTSRLGDFTDLVVLDLFAGSGALAFEALSRGAATAFLVENRAAARRAIESNRQSLQANARLLGSDATRLPPAPQPADLIFLDPPYGSGLAEIALRNLIGSGWLDAASWLSVETAANDTPDTAGYRVVADRRVGKAGIRLLRPDRI